MNRCTIGLLTWNAGEDIDACVGGMLAQTEPYQLIWIDNASADGTAERVLQKFPMLPPPQINSENRGFCGGHNQAIAQCQTRYYLALNQDAILASDYLKRLCDWMDEESELALTSGLILQSDGRIYSAGLVYPRVHFAFELGMGQPFDGSRAQISPCRRYICGVDGCAMMLRVDSCRQASIPTDEIFPELFFAYAEEVDLALRIARMGFACGVDEQSIAWHEGGGSGGNKLRHIRAGHFLNNWLLILRHQSWVNILCQLPYIIKGMLFNWGGLYFKYPAAFLTALWRLPGCVAQSRRFYHAFESRFGPTASKLHKAQKNALDALLRWNR